ncbi:hypothetical protein NDU88_004025 [Pleurodeles waltl]|uniref:Uncharacterized protein n=1 Tax=Pleurodeles waltl TaxID=8319 RepID=A0AAV7LH52_PLEWA|nr:hypothetical protein NDU88_004025 [Pleurodeles waltl]
MPLEPSFANLKRAYCVLHQWLTRPPFRLGAADRPVCRTAHLPLLRPSGGCFPAPGIPEGALLGRVVFHAVPAAPGLHLRAELRSSTPIPPQSWLRLCVQF